VFALRERFAIATIPPTTPQTPHLLISRSKHKVIYGSLY